MAIIDKPSDYFNTVLYTGNGGTQAITGVGFKPDLSWLKDRDGTPSHVWHDVIRGVHILLLIQHQDFLYQVILAQDQMLLLDMD